MPYPVPPPPVRRRAAPSWGTDGWKLAAALRGAPENVLDSYQEERRPVAARLMEGLNAADATGGRPDVFQLRNNYRGRALSAQCRRAEGPGRAGDRAPDALLRLAGTVSMRAGDLSHYLRRLGGASVWTR